MSTILDALKKVERERQSPRDQMLHLPEGEPKGSRRLSLSVITACAGLGFAAGVGLALWRDAPPVDLATVRDVPPPPVIDVPELPPDLLARGASAGAEAPAEPPSEPLALAVPPTAPATEGMPRPGMEPAPPGGAVELPSSAPAPAPGAPLAPPQGAVAAPPEGGPSGDESALEPSPFAPPRTAESGLTVPEPPTPPADAGPSAGEPQSLPEAVAALAPRALPAAPIEPETLPLEAEVAPPPAPEPPPAASEPVIDTGRSPAGAPRVALTFLQWSRDPSRRFAFVSIDGAPAQRIREGETVGSLAVAEITPIGVQFRHDGRTFVIRPRH